MKNNISIVLSESELTEMLTIVKSFERDGACIVLNGPIQPNSIDSILHYGQSDIYAGNGGLIKKAGEYFKVRS